MSEYSPGNIVGAAITRERPMRATVRLAEIDRIAMALSQKHGDVGYSVVEHNQIEEALSLLRDVDRKRQARSEYEAQRSE